MKHFLMISSFALVAAGAQASSLGIAGEFNAFIFGSATTHGGHSQGAVAVGQNWSGSGYDMLQGNYGVSVNGYSNVGMYVGGNVTFSNGGSINNAGTGHVGKNFNSSNPFNMNGGTLYVAGNKNGNVNGSWQQGVNTVDTSIFDVQKAFSLSQNAALAALGGEAINTSNPNNWYIDASTQAGNVKVYTISSADATKLRTLDITGLTADDSVIINVVGNSVNGFGLTVNMGSGSYDQLLWNFEGNSFRVTDRSLHGSLLAPNATVDQYQNIYGNLIAKHWNNFNSASLIYTPYGGEAVPEPASLAVLGIGAAALIRRRRNKR